MHSAYALLIFFSALLVPGDTYAFDPSQSIYSQVPPPAAYGLNIVRPEHRQTIDDHLTLGNYNDGENDPALVPLLYMQMHAEYLISLYDDKKRVGGE